MPARFSYNRRSIAATVAPAYMQRLPLSRLDAPTLRPLLQEEAAHWERELAWDFNEVSQAVAAGLERGDLPGCAMLAGTAPVAYCYYVREAARAVIGSLFASASHRDSGIEEQLLEHVLDEALADPESPRVECQTLFSTAAGSAPLFASRGFESRDRHYLERDLAIAIPAPRRADCLRPVRKADLPAIAEIVWCSHKGSLDASLNLTYATLGDCRRFVEMLVLRGACGRFDPAASFVAEWAGRPVGVILASRLSRSAGHVCQVSVRPDAQARGLGEALMEASLVALREQGLDRATLSVTVGNRRAQDLYRRLGFRLRRAFAAHAWARPAAGAGATA